jgi:2-oxoglutarate dehydrogenase E2 component (dihydrolipoamide succinyltransferase)
MGDQPVVAGQWLADGGVRVREGEPVLEVLAGSAVVDLPAPADGVLVEILVEEDTPLWPGQRLAVIESAGDRDPVR